MTKDELMKIQENTMLTINQIDENEFKNSLINFGNKLA